MSYSLSDPDTEHLVKDSKSVRRLVGQRLLGPLPDETAILNFLLYSVFAHGYGPAIPAPGFDEVLGLPTDPPYRVGLYWSASATWATPISSSPARSAIVRDSFSTRW